VPLSTSDKLLGDRRVVHRAIGAALRGTPKLFGAVSQKETHREKEGGTDTQCKSRNPTTALSSTLVHCSPPGRVCATTWERSDARGTRHAGPRCLASQPLGKWLGSDDLVREVLAGTRTFKKKWKHCFVISPRQNLNVVDGIHVCRRLLTKSSFFAAKCDGSRAAGENSCCIRCACASMCQTKWCAPYVTFHEFKQTRLK
jgi:hypothetical protein